MGDAPVLAEERGVARGTLARLRAGWREVAGATAAIVVALHLAIAYAERAGAPVGLEADLEAGFAGGRAAIAAVLHLVDFFIVTPLVLAIALLVFTRMAADADGLLREGARRRHRMLGVVVVSALLACLPLLPGALLLAAGLPAQIGSSPDPGALLPGVAVLALGLIPAAWIGLGFTAAAAIAAVEGLGIVASLRASWARMRGHRWAAVRATLALLVVVGVPAMLLFAGISVLALGRGPLLWSIEGLAAAVFSLAGTLVSAAIGAELWTRTRAGEAPAETGATRPVDPDAT